MDIKLAVFDMAGTTVEDHLYVAKAFQKSFQLSGFSILEMDVNPLMGYPKHLAIQKLLQQQGIQPTAEMVESIHQDFEREMIGFYFFSPLVAPMAGAEHLFLYLKGNGVQVALNTGFSHAVANAIVERFQWREKGLIDAFIGSDEVEAGRPYPYMIDHLCERLSVQKQDGIMKVGDTIVDIEEGKNAGCRYVVGVTTGACSLQMLQSAAPTHIINSLSEIPALFQSSTLYA